MNEQEHWRQIPGFSAYEASTFGNIRRVGAYTKQGRRWPLPHTIQPHLGASGTRWYTTIVDDEGARREMLLAPLIALTWIGKPPYNTAVVVHLDRVDANNRADNLGWALRPAHRGLDPQRRWFIVARFAGV